MRSSEFRWQRLTAGCCFCVFQSGVYGLHHPQQQIYYEQYSELPAGFSVALPFFEPVDAVIGRIAIPTVHRSVSSSIMHSCTSCCCSIHSSFLLEMLLCYVLYSFVAPVTPN